ncbi:ribosomal protein S18 acetylase RimI-like enzyme [Streptomyces sp. 840.1]|uniref:GNAT family N-acetyltransferase n=1 Tax=Streptomyces sp. 840.1 TaxID=2485152 RepID=UPI000F49C8F1|nr:GNAT family N-acetyltransferase [Streptomyces sp. 840.1]ROQ62780.1 ribosomal protein S18 acetylase RimI-like enzyme [Streptomyces sp. 840.1]
MTETPQQRYEISSDPSRLDPARIHNWLSTDAYWALGRTRERQDLAIAGSLGFGAYDLATGEQVGYARVVTDYATFGWLCDVYVDRAARGHGLGAGLVVAARDHLAEAGVRRVVLATEDAHGVYEKVGFKPLDSPDKWMSLKLG